MADAQLRGTDSLLELLSLEEIDVDLYRGVNEKTAVDFPSLYGGQVAAQALRAAAHTVPDGRFPHSLHGYFLRPGRSDRHVLLKVARDRDGGSFSARHVVAIQEGEVIFSMSASFHTRKPGPEFEIERPAPLRPPADVSESAWLGRFAPTLEMRPFPAPVPVGPDEPAVPARIWIRTREQLPDDPVILSCVLTYISDLGSGFGDGLAPGAPRGGPSIDHAVWFHAPIKSDEWVYLDMWPLVAGGSRGLYTGTIKSQDGRLGALLTQESLFLSQQLHRPPG